MKKYLLISFFLIVGSNFLTNAQGTLLNGGLSFNGRVNVQRLVGNTLYVGGNFTSINSNTGPVFSMGTANGQLISPSLPKIEGPANSSVATVNTLCYSTTYGYLIGGNFASVGGEMRTNFARLNPDMTVNSLNLNLSIGTINKILIYSTKAYVFGTLGGKRIDLTTNSIDSWNCYGSFYDAEINGAMLYVGGQYNTSSTANPKSLVSFNLANNGSLNATWNPVIRSSSSTTSNTAKIYDIMISNNIIYFGGSNINLVGGLPRSNFGAIDLYGNGVNLNIGFNNTVTSIASYNGNLYVGGYFNQAKNGTSAYLNRNGIVMISLSAGQMTTWNPNPTGAIESLIILGTKLFVGGNVTGIQGSSQILGLAAFSLTGSVPVYLSLFSPNPNGYVKSILQVGSNIICGGSFSGVKAFKRNRIAVIDITTGLPTSFNASVDDGEIFAIDVAGGNVFIGGEFTSVNGVFKSRFAALNTLGQNNPNISANFNKTVRSILTNNIINGITIYVGGDFRSVSIPATGQQVFVNFLTALIYNTATAVINPNFNANLNVAPSDYRALNVIRLINGHLYIGGRFTSPKNKIAELNISYGSVVPSFNSPIANALDVVEVNDITQVSATEIAICGSFPYGFTSSVLNANNTINYAANTYNNGGVAILNLVYGNLTLRSQTNYSSAAGVPTAIYKGIDNAIYYTNTTGLYRTSLSNGATSMLSNFNTYSNLSVNSLSGVGSRFFIGGQFSVRQGTNLFSFDNLGYIDFIAPSAPTQASSNLSFSSVTISSMTLSWTNGNGTRRIVLARQGSPVTSNPSDADSYPVEPVEPSYGDGSNVDGAFVVYDGTGSSFNLTGLQTNIPYFFRIIEYNGLGALSTYSSTFLSGAQNTLDFPTPGISATNVTFSSVGINSMNINWTRGNGTNCIVVAKRGSPVNFLPSNNTSYFSNPAATSFFGFGPNLGNGNFVIYNSTGTGMTLSNLITGSTYYVAVFEFNQNGALIRYRTTTPATGSQTTLTGATSPTIPASNLSFQNLGPSVTRVSWLNTGNGNKHLVLALEGKLTTVNNVALTNGVAYTANSNIGSFTPNPGTSNVLVNDTILGNARIVYNGTGTSVIVTGLLANTFYTYVVVDYNELTGFPASANYLRNNVLAGFKISDFVIQTPTINSSAISSIESNIGIRLTWTNGNGNYRIVVARQAGLVNWIPSSNINYAAVSDYSAGTDLGSGNKVVYNGSGNSAVITGLNAYTNYYFTVYEYNSVFNNGINVQEYAYLTPNPLTYIDRTTPLNWPRTAGGIDRDAAGGVAVDASGNVYVAGTFKGNSNWGLTQLNGAGNDIFLAKYNSNGDVLWIKSAGGTDDDAGAAVVLDASGNPYICGSFRSIASFDAFTVTSAGSDDAFIAKYNSNGVVQWVNRMGGTGQDIANSLAKDGSGNIILGGYLTGTVSFSGSTTTLTSLGQSDFLLAKYNSTGSLQWAANGGSTGYDFGFGVATDQNDAIYITGEIKGVSTFGGSNTGTYNGLADIALVKYSSAGVVTYANGYGSSGDDQGYGVAVDGAGQVYMVGDFSNTITFGSGSLISAGVTDGFIVKITGATGVVQWSKKQGGVAQDATGGVSVGTNGDIFVVGSFGGTAGFESQMLTSSGNLDIFTAIYTSTGVLNVAQKYGGPLDDAARGIFALTANNSYITGYFNGTANFGGYDVKARVAANSNGGDWDIFVHNIGATYNNDPSADLVAWFRLNGNANDFSGNGYNGTIVSAASPNTVTSIGDRNATSNSAYNFSGTGRIDFQIPSNPTLNNLNQLTVMGWVNVSTFFGINYEDRSIIATDQADGISFNLLLTKDQGIYGSVYDNGANTIGAGASLNYVYAPLGTWAHVALTYENGVQSRVFLNGNVAGTTGSFANSTFDLSNKHYTIGAQGETISSVFTNYLKMNGGIDDVRIYKRALTAVQIQDIMTASSLLSGPPHEEGKPAVSSKLKSGIVWPNPSTGIFNLEIEIEETCQMSFTLTDISGKTVYTEQLRDFENGKVIKTFNLDQIQNGYYILQVAKGSQVSTYKLIITK